MALPAHACYSWKAIGDENMKSKIGKLIEKLRILLADQNQYISILRKKGMTIGEGCDIDKTAYFGSEPYLISIANHVRITRGVKFITHDGGLWVARKMGLIDSNMDYIGDIHIGENTNIGWDAIIMPGVKIGKNCIIACGAIVTKDVPDNTVVAGVPAKYLETIEEYARKKEKQCIPTKYLSNEEKKKYLLRNREYQKNG